MDLDDVEIAAPVTDDDVLAVNDALAKLAAQEPLKAEWVKLRYFVGLGVVESADIRVDIDRPRDRTSSEFLRLRSEILELLHFAGHTPTGKRNLIPRRGEATLSPGSGGRQTKPTLPEEPAPLRATISRNIGVVNQAPASASISQNSRHRTAPR